MQTGVLLSTLRGHTGEVYAIAFSPDGRWIASGGGDSTVKVWDSGTEKVVRSFRGHIGIVGSVSFSPDGHRLASGSRDRTVKVWTPAGGTTVFIRRWVERSAMASRVSTSRLLSAAVIAAIVLSLFRRRAEGQAVLPPQGDRTPPYQRLRYDEDYLYLRDPALRSDPFDPVKYIPLNGDGGWYLSLGGDRAPRYEMYNNDRWNPAHRTTTGTFFALSPPRRLAPRRPRPRVRRAPEQPGKLARGRPKTNRRGPARRAPALRGREAPARPRGAQRTHAPGGSAGDAVRVRGLITVRDYANIRRGFDAVRLLSRIGEWRADAFFSRPVENDPGEFDDWGLDDVKFWGVYATRPLPFLPGAHVDLYYLGLDRPEAPFVQGKADELRHSVGGRVSASAGRGTTTSKAPSSSGRSAVATSLPGGSPPTPGTRSRASR